MLSRPAEDEQETAQREVIQATPAIHYVETSATRRMSHLVAGEYLNSRWRRQREVNV
jgi:hypothetical protein